MPLDPRDEEVIWLLDRFPDWSPMFDEPAATATGWIRLCGMRLPDNVFIAIKDLAGLVESLR